MKTSSSYKLRYIVSLMSILLILGALFAGVFVGVTYADGQGMIALLDSVDLDGVVSWTLEEEPATYPYFYVNVTITNVTDVTSAPFSVHWDPTILSLTDIIQGDFLEPPGTGGISSPLYMVNYTAGYLEDYAYTQLYPFAPKSFPATTWGWVATLKFEFIGTPPTADFPIDTDIVFVNEPPNRPTYWAAWEAGKLVKHSFAQMLPCHFHYEAPQEHDVAVTSVVPSTFEVFVGDSVDINVTVKNEGNVEESFTVNLYAGVDLVGTETATLAAEATGTYTFTWTTTAVGNFTIRAEVPAVPDEVDTTDNTYTDGTVTVEEAPALSILPYVAAAGAAAIIIAAVAIYFLRIRKPKPT